MNYIVLDLEMNNKWGTNVHEVIEIGAIKINENLKMIDRFQSYVKPVIHPKIARLIAKKTKIKQDWVDRASKFPVVMNRFKHWVGNKEYILCGWGYDDLITLKRNSQLYKVSYELSNKYYDVQSNFSNIFGLIDQPSLKNALEILNIKTDYNVYHNALYDAINTSKIFKELFNNSSTFCKECLSIHREEEPHKFTKYYINKYCKALKNVDNIENIIKLIPKERMDKFKKVIENIKTNTPYSVYTLLDKRILNTEILFFLKYFNIPIVEYKHDKPWIFGYNLESYSSDNIVHKF